jgi:hypothetical protein
VASGFSRKFNARDFRLKAEAKLEATRENSHRLSRRTVGNTTPGECEAAWRLERAFGA